MAEFDSSGFSAVAAFFGEESTKDVPEKHHVVTASKNRGAVRQGVGAQIVQATKAKVDDSVLTKRLLQVGKRKHEVIDDEVGNSSSSDESDEEDEGRTAIQETRKKLQSQDRDLVTDDANKAKKKKKAGKKERKLAAAEASHDDSVDVSTDSKALVDVPDAHGAQDQEHTQKKTRKRPKIRSKQKNIRKDTRLPQHKPAHLIVGRTDYQGRPLTTETRARLNLPPSKSSRARVAAQNDNNEDAGIELAVDGFLGDDSKSEEVQKSEDISHDQIKKSKKKKKHRKQKYKNLM